MQILVIFAVSAVVSGIVLVVTVVSGVVLVIVVIAVVAASVLVVVHIVVLRHEKYLLKCLFSDYNHSMVRHFNIYSRKIFSLFPFFHMCAMMESRKYNICRVEICASSAGRTGSCQPDERNSRKPEFAAVHISHPAVSEDSFRISCCGQVLQRRYFL